MHAQHAALFLEPKAREGLPNGRRLISGKGSSRKNNIIRDPHTSRALNLQQIFVAGKAPSSCDIKGCLIAPGKIITVVTVYSPIFSSNVANPNVEISQ